MNLYAVGAFINGCEVRWRSIEGFSEAVDYLRSVAEVSVEGGVVRAASQVCEEVNKLLQRPLHLLTLLNIADWVLLVRGLYDFNGELMDPEPSLDMPNLVLSMRVPSRSMGLVVRIVLRMLGISSNTFPGSDGSIYVVIHTRDSIARFVKTIKPHLDPEQNFVLRDKWVKHYAGHGDPIVHILAPS